MDVETLYNHYANAIKAAGLNILGTAQGSHKPRLTDELYGMLKRARDTRKLMLSMPRGSSKVSARAKMYEDCHTFYLALKRHRQLTLEEYQLELAVSDQGEAWKQFNNAKRRLAPA